MIVSLKNIGTLQQASFDLDKDLIVFIGPNNTGKTFASYCLYGLAKYELNYSDRFIDLMSVIDFDTLLKEKSLTFSLSELFTLDIANQILKELFANHTKYLPQIFAAGEVNFKDAGISVYFKEQEELDTHFGNLNIQLSSINSAQFKVLLSQTLDTVKMTLVITSLYNQEEAVAESKIIDLLRRALTSLLFQPFSSVWGNYFVVAERIGISAFGKELIANRFLKSNEILVQAFSESHNIPLKLGKEFVAFPLAIQDALLNFEKGTRKGSNRFTPDQGDVFSALSSELEDRIFDGQISIDSFGEVNFQTRGKTIGILSSGSVIKSLLDLVLYLRYYATVGQTLFIDEPEINLHPDNQRLVARILAKLSRLGVKVVVSTHSDYFIKELNNLIMLNKEHPDSVQLREKYGYDASEILDYKKVGAYLFRDNKATELKVSETGMEAATIDEEINKLNNTSNDIYWTLFEE